MDNRPIGFLDSGVGGLTVARELMRQLPHEEIVYIGDSARAPYGPRPAEQIREYTWQLVNFLGKIVVPHGRLVVVAALLGLDLQIVQDLVHRRIIVTA